MSLVRSERPAEARGGGLALTFSLDTRAAGILLHPTSLPGPYGCGDLGAGARRFVDFLAAAGVTWWQMLPIHPTGGANSPYSTDSAFAGNPLLIDLDELADEGLLARAALRGRSRPAQAARVDYAATDAFRSRCLAAAFAAFRQGGGLEAGPFAQFVRRSGAWLPAYAAFRTLTDRYATAGRRGGRCDWTRWPAQFQRFDAAIVDEAARLDPDRFDFERFVQFLFDRQWQVLRSYAAGRGVALMGDLPIFVNHDSADVWSNPRLFLLDDAGRPKVVSGVPPDMFSRTGQLWGHPLYDWPRHVSSDRRGAGRPFAWWCSRFDVTLQRFDAVRVDHFLGFNRLWAVPGRAKTAMNGSWLPTPGQALLTALKRRAGKLPLVAEDLGVVTPEAFALRDGFDLPGMRILQHAFDPDGRYHQPHNFPRRCAVYTGTHDYPTLATWQEELRGDTRVGEDGWTRRERMDRYTGPSREPLNWRMIRLAFASPANLAIIPMQDVLGLGASARMNTPATVHGNWEWRLAARQLTDRLASKLRDLAEACERTHSRRVD